MFALSQFVSPFGQKNKKSSLLAGGVAGNEPVNRYRENNSKYIFIYFFSNIMYYGVDADKKSLGKKIIRNDSLKIIIIDT